MRIAICEDHGGHAQILNRYVEKWARQKGIKTRVVHYESAEVFLFHWSNENTFDVVFLDIEMEHANGLEMAQSIRQQDQGMLMILTTGLQKYVLRGYEVQAFRYMLKPIKEKECVKALDSALITIQNQTADTFVIIRETQNIRLFKREIYYFEMDHHYVIVHTIKGQYRCKERLSDVAGMVGEPRFCRCHRSFIVNLEHVATITRDKVEIDNDTVLPVSRSRWKALNQCFISYYVTLKDKYHTASEDEDEENTKINGGVGDMK